MASQVEIANRALSKLGDERIASFEDNSKRARAVAAAWNIVRDAELRRHRWTFAMKRANLAALSDPSPTTDFAHVYELPTDKIRLDRVGTWFVWQITLGTDYRNSDWWPFALEGRRILTNLPPPLAIRYVWRVEDTTLWDPSFVSAFACKLAQELAVELSGSDDRKNSIKVDYKEAILEAKALNAIELPPEFEPDNSWLMARIGP